MCKMSSEVKKCFDFVVLRAFVVCFGFVALGFYCYCFGFVCMTDFLLIIKNQGSTNIALKWIF